MPSAGYLTGRGQWTRDVVFNKDGIKLYVSILAHSNVFEDPDVNETNWANILEYNRDGTGLRIFAWGWSFIRWAWPHKITSFIVPLKNQRCTRLIDKIRSEPVRGLNAFEKWRATQCSEVVLIYFSDDVSRSKRFGLLIPDGKLMCKIWCGPFWKGASQLWTLYRKNI